jgi:DNA-binding transcriptional LysR family regulator
MRFPLRQLEAFHAVCRQGGITKAATSLGISQPAVSRLLTSFGASLGFELFQKSGGRLIPTQEASYLLREVERLLENMDNIGRLSHDLTDRRAGHLRIACLPGFATSHLPQILARFLQDKPRVRVTLEPDRPERILEWIIGEQYDCGISDEPTPHPQVECTTIAMRTVCILPKGHALARKSELGPEDLTPENLIHTRRDSPFYQQLHEAFASRGLTMPSRIETRQFTAACMLVASGAGVAVVSEMDAREYEPRGLILRPFRPQLPHRLVLMRPTNARSSLITQDFLEEFEASLAPYRLF